MQKTKRKKNQNAGNKSRIQYSGKHHNKQYGQTRKKNVKRTIKDSLFRFLFEKDKETLLQLYNALNGTDYHNALEHT